MFVIIWYNYDMYNSLFFTIAIICQITKYYIVLHPDINACKTRISFINARNVWVTFDHVPVLTAKRTNGKDRTKRRWNAPVAKRGSQTTRKPGTSEHLRGSSCPRSRRSSLYSQSECRKCRNGGETTSTSRKDVIQLRKVKHLSRHLTDVI